MSIADKITSIETHLENDYEGLENLGVTAEDRNIENIRTCLDELYNNIPKTTGEDTSLTLTTLKGKMNIIPKGNIEQETREGYNLFQAKLQTTTANGITVTNNNNGTFTINGTNTSTSLTTFRLDQSTQNGVDNLQNYEDGTYTLDLGIQNENIQMTLMQVNTWQQFIATGMNTRLKSGTITGATGMFIYIAIKGSATINNVIIKPMFVKGSYTTSTIPSFEEYGQMPSPSFPSDIEVVTGTQTITIKNSDNTETQTQIVSLGDIELCKIGNYQDYLYKSNGKWYKKENIKKAILNGSEQWEYGNITGVFFTRNFVDYAISDNIPYSSYYKGVTNVSGASGMGNKSNYTIGFINQRGATTPRLYIKNIDMDNANALKTWLETHNTILYYALETPNDIEITNETLIEQLDNLEKMKSYNGTTNIAVVGNLPMIMKVRALKGEKE
jgi:hypothetical protein